MNNIPWQNPLYCQKLDIYGTSPADQASYFELWQADEQPQYLPPNLTGCDHVTSGSFSSIYTDVLELMFHYLGISLRLVTSISEFGEIEKKKKAVCIRPSKTNSSQGFLVRGFSKRWGRFIFFFYFYFFYKFAIHFLCKIHIAKTLLSNPTNGEAHKYFCYLLIILPIMLLTWRKCVQCIYKR